MNGTDTGKPGHGPENGESQDTADAESRVAEAEARVEQQRADLLRAVAELENVRKRAAREVEAARLYGVERFASDLLQVAVTLGLAVSSGASVDAATLAEGQEATLRLLLKAFERAGLTVVDPAGEPFDPERHEAIATQPSADLPSHTVLQVVQKGWLLNGRLLRPARVIVSSAPVAQEGASAG
jgi:molecular chaperone GrpE